MQRCLDSVFSSFEQGTIVEASSALDAAEKVLEEQLSLGGDRSALVARVLCFSENFRPTSVMVYRVSPDP